MAVSWGPSLASRCCLQFLAIWPPLWALSGFQTFRKGPGPFEGSPDLFKPTWILSHSMNSESTDCTLIMPALKGSGLYRAYTPGRGLPAGSVVKNPPTNAGLISGSGRSPGEGNGHPLQYSRLGNPVGREAWQATVQGVPRLSTHAGTPGKGTSGPSSIPGSGLISGF